MTTLTPAMQSIPPVAAATGTRRGAGAAGLGFTAGDLFRIVRQRLILVLSVWILLIGATIGITWAWATYYPSYKADVLVQVESYRPGTDKDEDKLQVNVQNIEMEVKNQAVLVASADVLKATLEAPEVKATAWYEELVGRNDPTLSLEDELKDIISATPIPSSSFMLVSVRGRVPKDLPDIVNTLVDKYVRQVNELTKSRYRDELDRLQRESSLAKTALDQKNAEVDQFREGAPVATLTGTGINVIGEELMTLSALRTELEMQKLGRKQLYETFRNASPDELPVTADMQAAITNDPVLFALRQQVDEIDGRLQNMINSLGPRHRQVLQVATALENLRNRLMAGEMEKLNRLRNEQIQLAQMDYLQAQEQELSLAEKIEDTAAKQRDLDRKVARYLRMLEEREVLKTAYEDLQKQRDDLSMQLRQEKTVHIQVANKALPPKRRDIPKWLINMPVGIVVGLLLAVGLAVLLELADASVRTPRDVTRHASIPVLASIPALDDEEVEIDRIEMASINAPHSVVAEAFRQLRTNLFFAAPAEHQNALLITSPGASDGKTTVALNLAASIAISGRRVLLVDANFRRPALRTLLPNLPAEGLSNILVGQSKLADVLATSDIPGLDVVATGPTPPNPAELLGSTYLREMLSDARTRYDQVIFDGPPILLVSDATVLAGAVDGVVLVCRFRDTARGALLRARNQLDAINARVLGGVLNAVQTTRGGYFRKQYRAFYEYQAEEGAEQTRRLAGEEKPDKQVPKPDDAQVLGEQLEALDPKSASAEGESPPAADAGGDESRPSEGGATT